MFKEIKYLLFILIIFIFLVLTGRFYFSDNNKKNFYRSINSIDEKINPREVTNQNVALSREIT